jgi:hypothetical protein
MINAVGLVEAGRRRWNNEEARMMTSMLALTWYNILMYVGLAGVIIFYVMYRRTQ